MPDEYDFSFLISFNEIISFEEFRYLRLHKLVPTSVSILIDLLKIFSNLLDKKFLSHKRYSYKVALN